MTSQKQKEAEYQAELAKRLSERPAQIESNIQSERDLMAQRDKAKVNVQDLLSGDTSIQRAGQAQLSAQNPTLQRQQEQILSYRRMKEMNDFYNQKYQYAVSEYQKAGYDLKQTEGFARQWAQQQTDQEFQAGMAADERSYLTEKNAISNEYADKMAGVQVDTGNPYEQALLRSSMRLLPWAIAAGLTKRKTPNKQIGIPSEFNPPKSSYGYDANYQIDASEKT